MKKKIIISGRKIEYNIRKHKWSKNLRLTIRPCVDDEVGCEKETNLSILITAPNRVSDSMVEKFITEKSDWVLEKIEELKNHKPRSNFPNIKVDYKKEKEKAKKIITERVNHFGKLYGFEFDRISIRSQRTRWGSCSKNGNLNFNYKLIYLSEEIMDYVIVHELCHLDQFNHSKRFWFLVSEIIPDYKELRRELKKLNY